MAARFFAFLFVGIASLSMATGHRIASARQYEVNSCTRGHSTLTAAKLASLHTIAAALKKNEPVSPTDVSAWIEFKSKLKTYNTSVCKQSATGFCCKVCTAEGKKSLFCSTKELLNRFGSELIALATSTNSIAPVKPSGTEGSSSMIGGDAGRGGGGVAGDASNVGSDGHKNTEADDEDEVSLDLFTEKCGEGADEMCSAIVRNLSPSFSFDTVVFTC